MVDDSYKYVNGDEKYFPYPAVVEAAVVDANTSVVGVTAAKMRKRTSSGEVWTVQSIILHTSTLSP